MVSPSSNPRAGTFVKVFDVLDSGFRTWTFSAFGLVFVALGVLLFVGPRLIKATGIPLLAPQPTWQRYFRHVFLGFAILWTLITFGSTYSEHRRHQVLARSNSCRIVEGPVENFVPMPYGGHANESFAVANVRFEYSDFAISDSFNNTSSHGGPIDENSYVRICYDPSGNRILRLEIRDFRGVPKDYSKDNGIFERQDPGKAFGSRNPMKKLPWYASLFVWLGLADFLATLSLFLPYLNTFFCVKREHVGWPLSRDLEKRKKVKLRNTLLYWDDSNKAIWLRARGLNLVSTQLVVAKLGTDDAGRAVVNQEVRFSSGAPLVMIGLLATAHQMFSAVMAANSRGPSPGQFVAIAAVLFTAVGFVNAKILASRMEALIRDARDELSS